MGEAFAWGLVGQSTLLIGALIALWRPLSRRTLGLVMAFGSGVLLSAVSFELIERAIDTNQGLRGTTLDFQRRDRLQRRQQAPHATIKAADGTRHHDVDLGSDDRARRAPRWHPRIRRPRAHAAPRRTDQRRNARRRRDLQPARGHRGHGGTALEWMADGQSDPALDRGHRRVRALRGCRLRRVDGATTYTLAFVLAFAAGATLSMLSTSMMPEAYGHAGQAVGTVTVFGSLSPSRSTGCRDELDKADR